LSNWFIEHKTAGIPCRLCFSGVFMIVVSQSLPREYLSYLQALDRTTVILPPDPRLPAPVSSHPDMLFFIHGQVLITDRVYYLNMARNEIDQICHFGDLRLCLTDAPPKKDYPHDIRFNVLSIGQFFFCHPTHTSAAIQTLAVHEKKDLVPTHQGYARCAACPIGDHAMITADPSLASAAKKHDLDVCFIRQGHVLLPGYPHGLIGGCCGAIEHELFFCGDPSLHPDGESMLTFIRSHGIIPRIIPKLPLFDAGSLFFLPQVTT
jgi:hypothetical protein